MKANELMIADCVRYVRFLQTETGKIEIIQPYHIKTTNDSWLNIEEANPISITEDVLKANGFTEQPDVPEGCVNYVYNNGGQIVYISRLPWDSFSIDANFHGRLSMQIQYVHELQHILRLIGINELADNFKIQ